MDIPTLFEEVKLSVAPWTESEDIHIVWDIHSGTVAMEPNLMKDVFLNLIDNARKAIDTMSEYPHFSGKSSGSL